MKCELSKEQRAARLLGSLVSVSGEGMQCGPARLHAYLALADYLEYGEYEKALNDDDEMSRMLEICGDIEALIELSESWFCKV